MEVGPMRPIAFEQDPLRFPLNEILGTQAHVRLIRVMAVELEGFTKADIPDLQLDAYPIQRLARFFTSSSERANRLRRSNPFFAVLNVDERARMTSDL